MAYVYEGSFVGKGLNLAIVVSRFNEVITEKLLAGAKSALQRHGVADESLTIVYVPGAFEIPFAARKLAESGRFDAIIALGAVIRGSTPHFDYVCAETAGGISSVSQMCGLPVIFGVLTTDTIEQALERSGIKAGNKGTEAATAAIEMANLNRRLEEIKNGTST